MITARQNIAYADATDILVMNIWEVFAYIESFVFFSDLYKGTFLKSYL